MPDITDGKIAQYSEKGAMEDAHSQMLKDVFPSKSILETSAKLLGTNAAEALSTRPETYSAAALTDSVLREYGAGMYDHIKEHPVKLGMEAAAGAAASFIWATTYVPRMRPIVQAAGAAYAMYQVGKAGLDMADQAATLANNNATPLELDQAKQNIRRLGASSMDVLALTAGGAIGTESTRIMVNTVMPDYPVGSAMPEFFAGYQWKTSAIVASYLVGANNLLIPKALSGLVGRWVNEADDAMTKK